MSSRSEERKKYPVRELLSEDDWRRAWPAMCSLRPQLHLEDFLRERESLCACGYHLFGLEDDGRIVTVAGAVIQPHVEHTRELWLHDLATLEDCRSRGFGSAILEWLDNYARQTGCFRMSVHSRLHREQAHRFYERFGFERTAVVFQRLYR